MNKSEFKTVFRAAIAQEFSSVPMDENSIDYTFSNHFLQRMAKLLRATESHYWYWVNTAAKRIAVIVITVLCLCSAALSVEAIRTPVIEFITEIYETYIRVIIDGSTTSEITYEYRLSYIPDGYTETDKQITPVSVTTTYRDRNNNVLYFNQSISSGGNTFLDNENGSPTHITINEMSVIIYETDGYTQALWIYDGYLFVLCHYGEIPQETILEVIKAIK